MAGPTPPRGRKTAFLADLRLATCVCENSGMKYNLTTPCDECPFVKGSGFSYESLLEHASGEFPCHKQCDLSDEGEFQAKANGKTNHCAGALIFLEQLERPHQMMRICERLGLYDRMQLDRDAPVVESPSDCPRDLRRTASSSGGCAENFPAQDD